MEMKQAEEIVALLTERANRNHKRHTNGCKMQELTWDAVDIQKMSHVRALMVDTLAHFGADRDLIDLMINTSFATVDLMIKEGLTPPGEVFQFD